MSPSPPSIGLRPAVVTDCDAIWGWNNRPETRAVSVDPRPIPLDHHRQWFEAALAGPQWWLLVVEVDGVPAGIVRFREHSTAPLATISIALDRAHRGRGVGPRAVQLAVAGLAQRRPDLTVEAWVLDDNRPSVRCFEAAGFRRVDHQVRGDRDFRRYLRWPETDRGPVAPPPGDEADARRPGGRAVRATREREE